MSQVDFSDVPVEALEALRLRLTQLTHSLNKLHAELQSSQPPQNSQGNPTNNGPPVTHWISLQSQFNIILTQLTALSSTLLNYSSILEQTTVFPISEFPTTEQEGLLTTLLRKKRLPDVEEWIEESKALVGGKYHKSPGKNDSTPSSETRQLQNSGTGDDGLKKDDDEEITVWALRFIQEERTKYDFNAVPEVVDPKTTDRTVNTVVDNDNDKSMANINENDNTGVEETPIEQSEVQKRYVTPTLGVNDVLKLIYQGTLPSTLS